MSETAVTGSARQYGLTRDPAVLLNTFYPLTTAKVVALKATVLLTLEQQAASAAFFN